MNRIVTKNMESVYNTFYYCLADKNKKKRRAIKRPSPFRNSVEPKFILFFNSCFIKKITYRFFYFVATPILNIPFI